LGLINDKPFESRKEAAYVLKIHSSTINKYIDTNKFYLKNNNYFYFSSKLLTEEDKLRLQNLLNLQKLIAPTTVRGVKESITHKIIYVYDANLRLINNQPFPSVVGENGVRDSLKIGRLTIKKYIDTNKPYLKNNQYFYFSSKLLTEEEKLRLYNTNVLDYVKTIHSVPNDWVWQSKNVWVYRKDTNDKFVPYNNEEPTFKSHRTAAAETGCGRETIANKIQKGLTQKPVRGLYFFAEKQDTE
jgi:biotin operon repressor